MKVYYIMMKMGERKIQVTAFTCVNETEAYEKLNEYRKLNPTKIFYLR